MAYVGRIPWPETHSALPVRMVLLSLPRKLTELAGQKVLPRQVTTSDE